MKMKIKVHITCPYCSTHQTIQTDKMWGEMTYTCAEIEGGCAETFVIKWEIQYEATAIVSPIKWQKPYKEECYYCGKRFESTGKMICQECNSIGIHEDGCEICGSVVWMQEDETICENCRRNNER